jgi:hypothetical protein
MQGPFIHLWSNVTPVVVKCVLPAVGINNWDEQDLYSAQQRDNFLVTGSVLVCIAKRTHNARTATRTDTHTHTHKHIHTHLLFSKQPDSIEMSRFINWKFQLVSRAAQCLLKWKRKLMLCIARIVPFGPVSGSYEAKLQLISTLSACIPLAAIY